MDSINHRCLVSFEQIILYKQIVQTKDKKDNEVML